MSHAVEQKSKEWAFLRAHVIKKADEAGDGDVPLEGTTSDALFKPLAKSLMQKTAAYKKQTAKRKDSAEQIAATPSARQLKDFFISKIKPKQYLVDYLYLYAFGELQESFWTTSESQNLYDAFLDTLVAPPQYVNAKENLGQAFENLKKENEQLIQDKEKLIKDLNEKTDQLCKTLLWYKPPPIEKEAELKEILTFVNDSNSAFRNRVRSIVQSLQIGYQNWANKQFVEQKSDDLVWYKDFKVKSKQGILYYTAKGDYAFRIDKVTWTGFTKEEDPLNGGCNREIDLYAHTLFSDFVETLFSTDVVEKDETYLNKLLHIPINEYNALVLYVGFEADPTTLMARYPAYTEDMIMAGKDFVLTLRPWWRDAMDQERRSKFSWIDSIDDTTFHIGLSKPYQTIRTDAPNHRSLWVEIPIKPLGTMIMGIDLLLND